MLNNGQKKLKPSFMEPQMNKGFCNNFHKIHNIIFLFTTIMNKEKILNRIHYHKTQRIEI